MVVKLAPRRNRAVSIPVVPAASSASPSDVSHFLRPGTLSLPALPPLSLYVHYPWCVRKCPYCDFNSHEAPAAAPDESAFITALRADLESALPLIWGRRIISIFIGGGTPSLLSAAGLDRLLSDLRALLPLEADCEITLEANPGTFEAAKFASFRASGVNRLSIGIQSFNEQHLVSLGRIHDRAEALAAVEIARTHFDNFNLDLMHALPGQSLTQASEDLERALALSPPHLSLYQLTLEPNTVFAKFPPALPDEDTAAAMQDAIDARTAEQAYLHYEVSAYTRKGHACRHNLNYWSFGDYLGIGPGAHSKISFPQRIVRQVRYRQPASYLEHAQRGEFAAESFEVARSDLPFEFMLNALRLVEGFPSSWFAERTGLPVTTIEARLARAEDRGLLVRDHLRWAPTDLGLRFLSDLQSLFLPNTASAPG
jgi:oxygen-independent coproporphyrinogen-3 oxidase